MRPGSLHAQPHQNQLLLDRLTPVLVLVFSFILSFGAMLYQVIINGSSGLKASNPALEGLIAAAVFPVGLISE